MRILRLAFTAAALLLPLATGVQAQTTLRIGLAEDPDILDPTLARTYVGRIVFAAFCDKLFDIDEKLNIVPQLALSHETSADGKEVTIKLRPGVKFQDGEPFDAEAAKFSLDRHLTMQGSFRKPELAALIQAASARSQPKSRYEIAMSPESIWRAHGEASANRARERAIAGGPTKWGARSGAKRLLNQGSFGSS